MAPPRALAAVAALALSASAQNLAGTHKIAGDTLVSAMMMFLGNDENVYILDKSEGNPTPINGHPAWGSVWNIAAEKAQVVDVVSNTFCASGSLLPNGSWIALGGNHAVTPGPVDYHGDGPEPHYGSVDGRQAIRLVAPCTGDPTTFAANCQWDDDPTRLHMQAQRWYSTAEALGTGEIFIVGGMVNGGYINRPGPNPEDPVTQNNMASNTFEFWPVRDGFTPQVSNFLVNAGGLNTYALAWLMPSGKVLMQANISTILFDTTTFAETPLPDMPNGVIRVYPASAATAMLPLTPANNWTPTLLFCGGTSALTDQMWGGYGGPLTNAWDLAASNDCQRLTPEPQGGATVAYEQDDPMLVGRTMGQFVILPDGNMVVITGAASGTAGYTTQTPDFPNTSDLPYGLSLAKDEVLQPHMYYPDRPRGQRWSNDSIASSTIPRMYHSTALVLPDGSIFVAGSNPNADTGPLITVTWKLPYPAEYRAEYWYPMYYDKPRPEPTGIPTTALTYGGDYFNITLKNGSYTGSPNSAASKTRVTLLRSGFVTHALAMGQRFLQLNNTYTVESSGDITLHVSQLPPNANLFTPGPALMFVVVDGVPSKGKMVSVGTGKIEQQPTAVAAVLPPSVTSKDGGSDDNGGGQSDNSNGGSSDSSNKPSMGLIIGAAAGGAVALVALVALIFFFRRKKKQENDPRSYDDAPFTPHPGLLGASVSTQGTQQRYGDGGLDEYGSPVAPFAAGANPYRTSVHSSISPSDANLVAPRNYDAMAAARVPGTPTRSQYSLHDDQYSERRGPSSAVSRGPQQYSLHDDQFSGGDHRSAVSRGPSSAGGQDLYDPPVGAGAGQQQDYYDPYQQQPAGQYQQYQQRQSGYSR